MVDFKKTVAIAKEKVAKAKAQAFMARTEAIDAILEGADPDDVMPLCATALTSISPLCCDQHLEEFRDEFLEKLDLCVAVAREHETQDTADGVPPQVH
jgi:hypothetical protein